jgi:hypothetical protein
MEQDKQFEKNFFDEAYEYGRFCRTKGDIEAVLEDRFGENINLTQGEMQDAIQEAFAIQDASICWLDIAESAVMRVLEKRPKGEPKDLLNDTLKMIGLETMQCFRIDDVEFKDKTLRIDSFGDVYVVVTEATDDFYEEGDEVEHDYLTLGRILTQYPDKIMRV